eukprot:IDg17903t1
MTYRKRKFVNACPQSLLCSTGADDMLFDSNFKALRSAMFWRDSGPSSHTSHRRFWALFGANRKVLAFLWKLFTDHLLASPNPVHTDLPSRLLNKPIECCFISANGTDCHIQKPVLFELEACSLCHTYPQIPHEGWNALELTRRAARVC